MANLKDLIVNGPARFLGMIYGNLTGNVTGNVTGNCSGSSGSCTGNSATATTATKLGTATVGGTTTPIYLNAGTPTALSYTIAKSVPSDAKFTDTNTTYSAGTGISLSGTTFSNSGVRSITQDTSDGHKLTINTNGTNATITIPDNNTDTKNTAGSTDTSSKIFLIGATSQAANPQTYSHDTAYVGTDGCLYSGGTKVLTAHQSLANYAKVTTIIDLTSTTAATGATIAANTNANFTVNNANGTTTSYPGVNVAVTATNSDFIVINCLFRANIAAITGTFKKGTILIIRGDFYPGFETWASNHSISIHTPSGDYGKATNNCFPCNKHHIEEYIYYSGWYGRNYADVYAINEIKSEEYLPVTSNAVSVMQGKETYSLATWPSSNTVNLPAGKGYYNITCKTTTSGVTLNLILPAIDSLPQTFGVYLGNPSDSSIGATINLKTNSGTTIASKSWTNSAAAEMYLEFAKAGNKIMLTGNKNATTGKWYS